MRIRPPFIALGFLLIALILHFIFPIRLIYFPYNLIGIVFLGGIFLIKRAQVFFKKKGTPKHPFQKPKALVTDGPFKFTRNPMYLGLSLISLGIAFLSGSFYLFFVPIAFFLTINFAFIPREEKILEELFGEEFLDYKKQVRRWF